MKPMDPEPPVLHMVSGDKWCMKKMQVTWVDRDGQHQAWEHHGYEAKLELSPDVRDVEVSFDVVGGHKVMAVDRGDPHQNWRHNEHKEKIPEVFFYQFVPQLARFQLKGTSMACYVHEVLVTGGEVASASDDGTIRVWDVENGHCIRTLKDHKGEVKSICAMRRAQLASGSADTHVKVWNLETGKCVNTFTEHKEAVTGLCNLMGRLASGSKHKEFGHGELKLWEVGKDSLGKDVLRVFSEHKDFVTSICSLPGGRLLSGSADKTVKIWDVATGDCVATFEGHQGKVTAVVPMSRGRLVASGSDDGTVRIWEVESQQCLKVIPGQGGGVATLALLGGDMIISGCQDGIARMLDTSAGGVVREFKGHTGAVLAACGLGGDLFATGGKDHSVRLWSAETGEQVLELKGHTGAINDLCLV